jgi:hypothetical protein
MNDYLHVLSYKVTPQPIIDFVSTLRGDPSAPSPQENSKLQSKARAQSRVPQLFSFYQQDIKNWNEKRSHASLSPVKRQPSPRHTSPFNVLDVDLKGNSGTVETPVSSCGSMRE